MAEDRDGSGLRLEVQRSRILGEEDRRLGMDTYCLVNQNQATTYGGVERWSLDDRELRLFFTDEAATALGMPDGVCIRFQNRRDVATVRTALESILRR